MTDPTTEIDVDIDIQEILLAASQHDVPKLRTLIRAYGSSANPANVRDPETGCAPLHAAIAACEREPEEKNGTSGESANANGEPNGAAQTQTQTQTQNTEEQDRVLEAGVQTVRFLLQEGAIWNDLDLNDETPGCLARRLGLMELYEMIVDAGVRAELLLNRLDGYEELMEEDDEEEKEEGEEDKGEEESKDQQQQEEESGAAAQTTTTTEEDLAPELVEVSAAPTTAEGGEGAAADVTQARYLDSNLTFQGDRLLDQDQNGVMMAWETDIMAKSAQKLLPETGLRVLNIGHGLGIIDGFFQEKAPSAHHIVEAHPEVVAEMKRKGWHEKPGVCIHEGRWQDVLPGLVAEGVEFDAIYYDTFAESYADFRDFFSEQVIGLLEQEGRWSFFNGMGADRQISYDVYQKVVEMDIFEGGFDVEWEEIEVPKLEGEWDGVRRPYWQVDHYRLPLCKYMN